MQNQKIMQYPYNTYRIAIDHMVLNKYSSQQRADQRLYDAKS